MKANNAVISDFSKVIAIGTTEDNTYQTFNTPSEPKYIKSSRNAGTNNLEEQLIIGNNKIISETEAPSYDNSDTIKKITLKKNTTFGTTASGEKHYVLKTTSVIENPVDNNTHTLFINNFRKLDGGKEELYFVSPTTSIPVTEKTINTTQEVITNKLK